MHVESLGFRTDLALLGLSGSEFTDHGDHIAVRTPTNPTYWWGNFLILAAPPAPDDVPRWLARFAELYPGAKHVALGIDGRDHTVADLDPLVAAGLIAEPSTVLTTSATHLPPRPNTDCVVRALQSDDDWAQQVELSRAGEEPAHYDLPFVTAQTRAHRALVFHGHGQWFGAFLDGALAASLGVVRAGPGLGRYQAVKTHPDARNRGLAGTLVHAAGRYAVEQLGCTTLVIVADPDYSAIRVYRSCGFVDSELQLQAIRRPEPSGA